ncbi:hypothetical protein [Yoonia tamlensis]|uniref:hypothetical protein n=1 Tax=Yoonia tamlensis TaxID=390270 RepID=UPI001041D800|nr:hypothetical protein [Yoonia tamlensis]
MLHKLILTTALVTAGTSGAIAQGFTGGSIGIEYGNFADFDDSQKTLGGSVEYAIDPMIAVALDAAFYDFEGALSDTSLSNYTLHGIYKLNDHVSLGAWVGRDVAEGFFRGSYRLLRC